LFGCGYIYRLNDGEIDVADVTGRLGGDPIRPTRGSEMGGTGKKSELPGKDDGKSKKPSNKSSRKPPPATAEDDDVEDGDIATPKRDRYGEDDQPL